MKVADYIKELAEEMRVNGCIFIEGAVYMAEDFPAGFWRKLAKEVDYLESINEQLRSQ